MAHGLRRTDDTITDWTTRRGLGEAAPRRATDRAPAATPGEPSPANRASPGNAPAPGDSTPATSTPGASTPSASTPATSIGSARPASSELRPGPGFRIATRFSSVTAEQVAALAEFETTDISDTLNRLFTMNPAIRCVTGERPLFGPAVTVKVFPGDNLMVHKALDIVRPGDVIVVDTSGSGSNAVMGDLIANKAFHRGVAGFVVDGLVRDLPGLLEVGLPVYARGVTAFGPLHRGPGEVGHAVSCGGIVVHPGDAICADSSGIVVVRKEFANETIAWLREHRERMADYVARVRRGDFSNDWVDRQLAADGCPVT